MSNCCSFPLAFVLFSFGFICSLVEIDAGIRVELSSFGKAALRQKQVWVVCLGCDVFDLVEPVQGELPRRTEPRFLRVLVVIAFSLIVTLSLSISLALCHVKLRLCVEDPLSINDQEKARARLGRRDTMTRSRMLDRGLKDSLECMGYKLVENKTD